MTSEEKLVALLMKRGWHISCAESCTGGLLAASVINVPNASAVLDVSFITYANEAKIKYLGVSPDTIETWGVVSEQVAGEMALGAAEHGIAKGNDSHSSSDICIGVSTSGIAGPGGQTADKPVGMVCFGFFINGKLRTATKQFGAIGRNLVRQKSVEFALETLCSLLEATEA